MKNPNVDLRARDWPSVILTAVVIGGLWGAVIEQGRAVLILLTATVSAGGWGWM